MTWRSWIWAAFWAPDAGLCCRALSLPSWAPVFLHYCLDFMTYLFSERKRSLLSEVAAKCILRWTKPRSFFFSHHIPYIIVWRAGFIWFVLWFFSLKLNYSVKKATTTWKKQALPSWRPAWPFWVWSTVSLWRELIVYETLGLMWNTFLWK